MSNFQKVIEFMNTAQQSVKTSPYVEVFDKDMKLATFRESLILEEVKELQQAIKDKNMVEVVDALADILYVVYGAGASLGLDLDEAFDIVHKSNMTKFCKDEKEAQATVESYLQLFVSGKSPYDSPAYKLVNGRYVVYNKSTGKVLKSIQYTPATQRLKDLVNDDGEIRGYDGSSDYGQKISYSSKSYC